MGEGLLIPDPYEECTVEVRCSTVEGGGEGLYTRRTIRKGEIVSFYNGVKSCHLLGPCHPLPR